MGTVYKLLYQLNHYHFSGWPLDRWLMLGLVGLGAVTALGWLPVNRWAWVAVAVVLGLGLLLRNVARGRDYVHFTAQVPPVPGAGVPLAALEHVRVYATGRFEVANEARRFSHLAADYTSFAVREHAILARVQPDRFLLVGHWPADEIGMWYIFFRPQAIRSLHVGSLAFGRRVHPALCVEIETTKKSENGQSLRSGAKDRVYNDVVYLAFDSVEDCQRVWANLMVDAPIRTAAAV